MNLKNINNASVSKSSIATFILSVCFLFSSTGFSARILSGNYESVNNSVLLSLAYQGGCLQHHFTVKWIECGQDQSTREYVAYGLLLDSGNQDTCQNELTESIKIPLDTLTDSLGGANELPFAVCHPQKIYIKSSSSKVPFLIEIR